MPYGDEETIPLDPLYRELVTKYGRHFQQYSVDNGVYCVPIDLMESERLNAQHDMIQDFFDNELFFGHDGSKPDKVLDCGYGQAHWANEVAETYPDCEVTGIDIFPRNPDNYADNVELLCDDLNQSLLAILDLNTFDVINSRFIEAGLHRKRWQSYIRELARLLKPGGSLQLMEYHLSFSSETNAIPQGSALHAWSHSYQLAVETDREPGAGRYFSMWMQRAGLVDVETRCYALPIGAWGTSTKDRQVGELNLGNFDRLLDSFALYPFSQRLGMTREQINEMNRSCRDEGRDLDLRAYIPLYVAWARKPL